MSSTKRRGGKDRQSGRRKSEGRVIVVGAGVAGLAAGAALAERGVPFTILEARDRIGGRVWTRQSTSLTVPVELGAEFIHGEADEVFEIAARQRLRTIDIDGRRWRSSSGTLHILDDFWERLDRVMRRLDKDREPDRSFAAAVASNRSLHAADRALAMQFVSGFHAANPEIISERALAEGGSPRGEVRERRLGRVLDGYDQIVAALASTVRRRIRLRTVVRGIRWRRGQVTVTMGRPGGKTISGRAVIVTVPLGVLAASPAERGAITFDPPLPPATRSAIDDLTMGNVARVALEFDVPFWMSKRFAGHAGDDRLDTLAFLHGTADVDLPIWWTSYPVRAPLLVGWCGGPRALRLAALSDAELKAAAVRSLAELLSVRTSTIRTHLVAVHHHDWINDPFSLGAYSYPRVGGSDAAARLSRPVDGTLFLAGEAAAADGRNGTVHGAIASGRRAAEAVLRHRR